MDPRGNSGLISLMFPRSGNPGGCGMGTVLSAILSYALAIEEDNGVQVRYGWFEEETGAPVEVMSIELYMAHVSATKIIADAQRKSWSAVADTRTHRTTWYG